LVNASKVNLSMLYPYTNRLDLIVNVNYESRYISLQLFITST